MPPQGTTPQRQLPALALLICTLLGLAGGAFAAGLKMEGSDSRSGPPPTTGALPGPLSSQRLAVDANYRLGAGDVVLINVFGEPTLSGAFEIGPGGSIALPILGQINLRGMTLAEAQDFLTQKVSTIVRRPDVTVALNELASVRKVYVTGEVMRTGALNLPFGATLPDALAAAGPGALADLRRVRLTHPGAEPVEVDCTGMRGEGPLGDQYRLEFGDTVYVPRVAEEVTVLGEVMAPGTVPVPVGRKVTVIDALRAAGGFAPGADRSMAVLLREKSEPIPIDLQRLLEQGDRTADRELQPGDVLVVHRAGTISVVGQVRAALVANAAVPVPILQALAQAGGPLPTGDLTRASIIRGGKSITVNLQAFLDKGEAPAELALRPGDVLLIPKGEPQSVLLTGALMRNGTVDLRGVPERDLLHIITLAGPVLASDLSRVTVYRGQETIVRNLKALQEQGARDQNLDLLGGDMVFVPTRTADSVLVTGQVARRGVLQITDEAERDLLRIVTLAGPDALADLSHVQVHRGGQTLVRDLKAAAEEGKLSESMPVRDGDVILVPQFEQSVMVSGAVTRVGPFRLLGREQRDLAMIVALAAPLPTADLSAVVVTRGDSRRVMNLKRYLEEGDKTQTLQLQDGDVVRVPAVEGTVLLSGALMRTGILRLYDGTDRDLGHLVLTAGPLPNANLEKVTVHRGGQSLVRNLKGLYEKGDRSQTLDLEAGDIVVVPPRELRTILVSGAVYRGGVVQVDDERRDLARLVTLAGPLPDADLTRVQVHRGEMTAVRNIKAYLDTGGLQNTLDLEEGDVVVVPRGENAITIVGAVMRSGTLQLVEEKDRDLFRVVTLAGPAPNANLTRVTVYRGDQTIVKDLKALQDRGDRSQTMTLQDGDIVKVAPFDETVIIAGAAARNGVVGLGNEASQRDLARMVLVVAPAPYADLRKISVFRGGKVLSRNVYAYLYEGDMSQTLALQDGDVVVIPLDRQTATVMGAVGRAGPVRVADPQDRDLGQILLMVGVLPTADLTRVTVRSDAGEKVYDFSGLRAEGKPTPKVDLLPGQTVFVPGLAGATVLVTGAVARAGTVELVTPQQRDLATLVTMMGPLPDADLANVTIYRKDQAIIHNVKAYLEKGDRTGTEMLQDGDRVLVPQLGAQAGILITGQVMNQGVLPQFVGAPTDLLRAVTLSVPNPQTADLTAVAVFRQGKRYVRDLQKLREEGDLSQNMALLPGDVVFVPQAEEAVVFAGELEHPGPLNVHGLKQRDLARLLPLAAPKPSARTESVTIYRKGAIFTVDYRALVEKGDLKQNLQLEPGDLVYVPPDHSSDVMVLGAMQRNGPITVREEADRDLLKIITTLGPTPIADLSRVTIFRQGAEPMYRDLKALMDDGDLSQNMKVQPGDVVMVPKMATVYIFGAVGRQGAVPVEANSTVLDAITNAGGLIGSQERVIIIRRRPDGKAEKIEVRIKDMEKGVPPEPVRVKAGDLIYVPGVNPNARNAWDVIRDLLWNISNIANTWYDLRLR